MLPFLRGSLPPSVGVVPELAAGLPLVQADSSLLRQLVTNLCLNAAEALPGGGTVKVRTLLVPAGAAREPLPPGWSSCRHGAAAPEERVLLQVEDGGCGMDGETLDRIFDPFYSTKFVGRGLGLPAVRGIVESHGGFIEVASCPGAGTVVSVSLPAAEAPAPPRGATPDGVPAGGKEGPRGPLPRRILLAEDEEDVRHVLASLIASLGYEAVEACDGQEALEIFSARPDDFGLVLLDLVMPRLTGDRAFGAMRRLRPLQKGILSSGYDESGRVGQYMEEGFSGFLQKPYRRGDLARRLEAIIGPPAGAEREPGDPGERERKTKETT
jgi:CheY-like chemotaxis protein